MRPLVSFSFSIIFLFIIFFSLKYQNITYFPVEEMITGNAIAYIKLDCLSKSMKNLKNSHIYNAIDKTKLLKNNFKLNSAIQFLQSIKLDSLLKIHSFDKIFSKTITLALLANERNVDSINESWSQNFLFIIKNNQYDANKLLFDLFGTVQKKEKSFYQGFFISSNSYTDGPTIFFLQYHEFLFCSFDKKPIQYCIDQILQKMIGNQSGAKKNSNLMKIKIDFPTPQDIFLYVDIEALRHYYPDFPYLPDPKRDLIPQSIALAHRSASEGTHWYLTAFLSKKPWGEFLTRHQLAMPEEEPVRPQTAQQAAFFFWTNWFKAKMLFHSIAEKGSNEIGILLNSLAQQLTAATGTPIDAFFDAFGNGFGVMMSQYPMPNQQSRSMACLLIEMRDQSAVKTMLKRLLAHVQTVTVVSEGTEIVSIVLAGGLLQPAYAIRKNYLLIADHVSLIEQIWRQVGESPLTTPQESGLHPTRSNLWCTIHPKQIMDQFVPMVTLLNGDGGNGVRFLSPKNSELFRTIIFPWANRMRPEDMIQLRGRAEGDALQVEMIFSAQ